MSAKKEIDKIIGATQKTVDKYTHPVFTEKNKKPELIASSVTIQLESKYYLITASHVVNDIVRRNGSFIIGVNGKLIPISGEFVCSKNLEKNISIDDFDISYIELDSNFVVENKIKILEQKRLLVCKYQFSPSIAFIHGFPSSRNKQSKALRKTKSFRVKAYAYAGIIDISFNQWDKFNKRIENHTCMSYRKTSSNNIPTHPRGISGGGLWIVPNISQPNEFFLDSILIEYYKNDKIVFATKIIQVVNFIKGTSLLEDKDNIILPA